MDLVLTNEQMRSSDAYTINELGVLGETLMNRAGEAVYREVAKKCQELSCGALVVCGGGNNGGDGYVIARLLFEDGFDVCVLDVSGGRYSADCMREREKYKGDITQKFNRMRYFLIVDAIFGTGLSREVSGLQREAIEYINRMGAYVISVDVPSGLDGDNGGIMGVCVKADMTCAIERFKTGHLVGKGLSVCGELIKKPIGIHARGDNIAQIYHESDLKELIYKRPRYSNKGTYGSCGIVAGSKKYVGAGLLSVSSCLKTGVGYTRHYVAEGDFDSFAGKICESILETYTSDDCMKIAKNRSVLIGSGKEGNEETYLLIKSVAENLSGTLVLDAGVLTALSIYGDKQIFSAKNPNCNIILTPHIAEFARLLHVETDYVLQNSLTLAKNYARENGIILVLKSATTIITDGERTVFNVRGNSSLSRGGSGDALAGLIAGFSANCSPFDSAVLSTNLLGIGAELASEELTQYCVTTTDVIGKIPHALKKILY